MLRINLLPTRERKKESTAGRQIGLLVVLLFAAASVGMYMWHEKLAHEAGVESSKVRDLEIKVRELEQVKMKMDQREEAKKTLAQQNFIFDQLEDDKIGPPNALLFMSYLLTHREDNTFNAEELRAREDNDWNTEWDSSRLWITKYNEMQHEVDIVGEAIAHEDVTEFYRRLDSSIYFYDVEPDIQVAKHNDELDMRFVEFRLKCMQNYDLEGIPRPLSELGAGKKGKTTAAANPAKSQKR